MQLAYSVWLAAGAVCIGLAGIAAIIRAVFRLMG